MLNPESKATSLRELIENYTATQGDIEEHQRLLIEAANEFAAQDDLALSRQSSNSINTLFSQIKRTKSGLNVEATSKEIYTKFKKESDRETLFARNSHNAQGHFNTTPLHSRDLKDQMQDHDMTQLMPKSSQHIEVMAVFNQEDRSIIEPLKTGIVTALKNQDINHIMLPIGPGHWRGIYLTKPTDNNTKYELELFDPYGPEGAEYIELTTLKLLEECGITKDQLNITYSGPNHPQTDVYACGDFTCAYSHKKMQSFGADQSAYNSDLIRALDHAGNENNSLRAVTREIASETLTPKEVKILNKSVESSVNKVSDYKKALTELIVNRDAIIEQAKKASDKKTPLSDEEYAATLQAEEFKNVGLGKRR